MGATGQDVDPATWKLELAGMIGDKRAWSLRDIYALPEVTQRTRHVCVEGWDYIGEWTGVPLRLFLERIGADMTAKYVGFKCIDGYSGSIDMASALHPQTQLTTKYAGEVIHKDFGFPCACAWRLSSVSSRPSRSSPWRSPTAIPADIGKTAAITGSAASDAEASAGVTSYRGRFG